MVPLVASMEDMSLRAIPAVVALACALAVAPGAVAKDIDGTEASETLTGTAQPDTIRGMAGGDKIEGRAGGDTLDGGSENDILWGGKGGDLLLPGKGIDSVDGGPGNDVVKLRRDGSRDLVQCRGGKDKVYVAGRDPGDVFIDCETVIYQ